MNTSEQIDKISKSLLKAQVEMEGAVKDSSNPFFKSSYADYNAVLKACKTALNDNGITILQPHDTELLGEKTVAFVETILLHESGQFIKSKTKMEVAKANDPQAFGSAVTYARRYGLQSLVALPSEDDDGEKAMDRKQTSFGGKKTKKTTKKVEAKPATTPAKDAGEAEKPARSFRRS